jgi:hypothetical protein
MVMRANPGATDAMQARLSAMRGGTAAPPVAAPPQAAPQENPLDAVRLHLVEALKVLQAMSEA